MKNKPSEKKKQSENGENAGNQHFLLLPDYEFSCPSWILFIILTSCYLLSPNNLISVVFMQIGEFWLAEIFCYSSMKKKNSFSCALL